MNLLASIGVSLCVLILMILSSGCRENPGSALIVPNPSLLDALLNQYPLIVSSSPSGHYTLFKSRLSQEFEILVKDEGSGETIASARSPDTQLSLTWRPDGKAIAFQSSHGGDRRYSLFVFDLQARQERLLQAPQTHSAAPPLRWSPDGSKLAYVVTAERRGGTIRVIDVERQVILAASIDGIALDGDLCWSPDGQSIAAIPYAENGSISIVDLESSKRRELYVSERAKVRYLAWAPGGHSLLATVRSSGEEFFQLLEIPLDRSAPSARVSYDGDISLPIWLPNKDGFIYHAKEGENVSPWWRSTNGSLVRVGGLSNGVNQVQSVSLDGRTVFVSCKSAVAPASIRRIDLLSGLSSPVGLSTSPNSGKPSGIAPKVVQLISKDRRSIPALLWRAPVSVGPTPVLIEVHGGPHIHSSPEWDAGKQFLLARGIHVLSVDYRGSSGYGASFEDLTDQAGQIDDVLAACAYATDVLKAPTQGVVLCGSSYGCMLVMDAGLRMGERLAGVVLMSVSAAPSDLKRGPAPSPTCVGFHGQNDTVLSAAEARSAIEQMFGSDVFNPSRGHWEVLPDEGHQFHRTVSWAKVYTAILDLLSPRGALR